MARDLAELGLSWDDDGRAVGFQIGKAAALLDSQHRREEREFKRLVRRLQWRRLAAKRWRDLTPEQRAAVVAYRKRWAAAHPEQMKRIYAKARKKRRSNPRKRALELQQKRDRRKRETQERRAATVYTCAECGSQWSPWGGRLPARPPKYCSQSCRGRAGYKSAVRRGVRGTAADAARRRTLRAAGRNA